MSTEQAPAVTAPETPAEAPPSKFERALAAFRPAAQAAPEVPAAEPAPEVVVPPEPPAENEDLKKAREQQAYLKYQRESVEAKARAKELETKLKGFEVFEGKDAAAIHAELRKRGVTLEALARAQLAEPEVQKEPESPLEAKVRQLEEQLAEKAKLEAEAQSAKLFEQNVGYVSELLTKEAEKYPALAGFKRAPQEIVQRFNAAVEKRGEPPEDVLALVHEIASEFNTAVLADVDNILSSDAALKAYIARPEIKSRVLSFLGAKQSAGPASSEGENGGGKGAPTAIPSTASANSSARSAKPLTRDEKFAMAVGNLKLPR